MRIISSIGAIALSAAGAAGTQTHWIGFGEGDAELRRGARIVGHGPGMEYHPGFRKGNPCIDLDGRGAHAVVVGPETSGKPEISIEAWVDLRGIGRDENCYVVGKGRTDPEVEDQHWALRVRGVDNEGALSFLFQTLGDDGRVRHHRWTSVETIRPNSGWHHLAVDYVFGKPQSLAAFIDGMPVGGRWDMDGPTDREPISSNPQIWIGSARGGHPGNSFNGRIDEVVYRDHLLGAKEAAKRFHFNPGRGLSRIDSFPRDRVAVEIFETGGSHSRWPALRGEPDDRFEEDVLGLFRLPPKYNDHGVRADRELPFVARVYTAVTLAPGEHEILLRSRGGARLRIDGEVVASTPFMKGNSNGAHNRVIEYVPQRGLHPLPLGEREVIVKFDSPGARHEFAAEVIVGGENFRPEIGELVVATRPADSELYQVVSPTETLYFTPRGWKAYIASKFVPYRERDAARRRVASADRDAQWREKHRLLVDGDPLPNRIDEMLERRRSEAAAAPEHTPPERFYLEKIEPILAEHCLRCHGEKEKGDLRLDDRARALVGGESEHPAIVPGEPGTSWLLRMVSSEDPDERMPPKGGRLTGRQIADLETWIADGAHYARQNPRPGELRPLLADLPLLRRLYLDTVGVPPTEAEIRAYLEDEDPRKYQKRVDRLLADPRWADHWTSYWQDVLAENPNLLKPSLNNTGPFRHWIHESMLDNKPMDRFVHELVTFQGSRFAGGAAGFAVASENDVPMAQKAHILGTAFLGVEMKCARCHDAPFHRHKQRDLFSLAAMLAGKPIKVPDSSSVPKSFFEEKQGGSKITVSIAPGSEVRPAWPFKDMRAHAPSPTFRSGAAAEPPPSLTRRITSHSRFHEVMVNRVWKRLMGRGLVEPVHDWEGNRASHPALLVHLRAHFIRSGYDLRAINRVILTSQAYRRESQETRDTGPAGRFFEGPERRRMSAEQIVDSLHHAVGRPIEVEEINFDIEGFNPASRFINFGVPRRAWQFTSLSNERDRPSLVLPRAQAVLDVLEAFGWRGARPDPLTDRRHEPDMLQPAVLANGTMSNWLTQLPEGADSTRLALRDGTLEELINSLYLRFLTRLPNNDEREKFNALLGTGFDTRIVETSAGERSDQPTKPLRRVSWSNHFDPIAHQVRADEAAAARRGDPPTPRLDPDWRVRMEDALWALINSPEVLFVP